VVIDAYNPSTYEAKAVGSKFEANLGYIIETMPQKDKKGWGCSSSGRAPA
jgi:hypothetical protein